jgi:hypothetical protein
MFDHRALLGQCEIEWWCARLLVGVVVVGSCLGDVGTIDRNVTVAPELHPAREPGPTILIR